MGLKRHIARTLTLMALLGLSFSVNDVKKRTVFEEVKSLEQRISNSIQNPNNKKDKFAVLIGGRTERRHKLNLLTAYQVLLENEFKPENIYILESDGKENEMYPIDGSASRDNFEALFGYLRRKIDQRDLLFVFVTDHGARTAIKDSSSRRMETVCHLEISKNLLISDREFASYFDGINPKTGVLFFDHCYSGGFAEKTSRSRFITMSSTQKDRKAYSDGGLFLGITAGRCFMTAFRQRGRSDTDYDGKVSIKEAYDYMCGNFAEIKKRSQTPVIRADSLDASKVFLY